MSEVLAALPGSPSIFLPVSFHQRKMMCTPSSKAAVTAGQGRTPLHPVRAPGTKRQAAQWLPMPLMVECCPLSSALPATSPPHPGLHT